MAILNNSNAISSGGYDINNSLRFRSSASAYLSRTPASAGNRQKYTRSVWIKRGALSTAIDLFAAGSGNLDTVRLNASDTLMVRVGNVDSTSNRVFRDVSAWGHLVVSVDTTQATSTERMKAWWNNEQITWSTYNVPAQNTQTEWNNNAIHTIGASAVILNFLDGYLTEFYNIDGQALTPSSFGETDTTTGSWKPKAYTGTYGTNGFYLKFSDIATTSGSNAGLGKDFSGNTNYWTTNNISVTSGTTYDAMKDSPTNTSATVANYCTLNPVDKLNWLSQNAAMTFTNGNLTFSSGSAGNMTQGTIAVNSGKWYYELTFASANTFVGIRATRAIPTGDLTYRYYNNTGAIDTCAFNSASPSLVTTVASSTSGDVMGVAFDLDNNTISWYKNNTLLYTLTGVVADTYAPATGGASTATASINFGQRPFVYTPPTGFVALNTYNLPTPTILQGNKYMDATLYTGTGASLSVTNTSAFKPDFVWVKGRSGATDHALYDSVRGTTKQLESNTTTAETTESTGLTAFGTNGFTVGALAQMNTSSATYVGWQWQAGQGSTSSGTGTGGITSVTQSVNATAGFSIVTYTGSGSNGTVTHGLGVAPKWIIVKARSAAAENWQVYSSSLTSAAYRIRLNATDAQDSQPTMWNSTAPTSTVFSVGTASGVNTSAATYVAYCWAEIAGFSKFTSYTGNGSTDGPFIFLGFRPKYVLLKRTNSTGDWETYDTSRDLYNPEGQALFPNLSNAESSISPRIDLLSNGFKLRTSGAGINGSGDSYIVAAFAENPFKNSNAR
jgi:hypothetical protein